MLRIAKKNISRLDRWGGGKAVILEEKHHKVKSEMFSSKWEREDAGKTPVQYAGAWVCLKTTRFCFICVGFVFVKLFWERQSQLTEKVKECLCVCVLFLW